MGLEKYRAKRNFTKTPEPLGTGLKSRRRRFVVQKHAASHLHYDLRLEMDGVLKSWAVPKGPATNPQDKRLAIMVEDHPVDYLKFAGAIPQGNYGAGQVEVWDIGTYQTHYQNEKELLDKLKGGHISFFLNGKKLKGGFDLIKLKNGNQWLWVKKRDKFATG